MFATKFMVRDDKRPRHLLPTHKEEADFNWGQKETNDIGCRTIHTVIEVLDVQVDLCSFNIRNWQIMEQAREQDRKQWKRFFDQGQYMPFPSVK